MTVAVLAPTVVVSAAAESSVWAGPLVASLTLADTVASALSSKLGAAAHVTAWWCRA